MRLVPTTVSSALGAHPLRCLLMLVALLTSGHALAQTRVGYVDMQRLLDNAPQMSSGSDTLRTEFAERDRQLKGDEARLERLQQQRRSAEAPAAANLDAEIDALQRRVRRTRENLREELRRRSEEELEQRWREITEAVAAFARDENYDLIVSSPVFYASPSIDITDRILARLRQTRTDSNEP
jgi:outer membrane protein